MSCQSYQGSHQSYPNLNNKINQAQKLSQDNCLTLHFNTVCSCYKELIEKCQKHTQCELSLFNVYDKKLYCPKCVIFCQDSEKREIYEKMEFIEIDSNEKNQIENVLRRYADLTESKIIKLKQEIMDKAMNIKEKQLREINSKIQKQYKKLVDELTKRKTIQQTLISDKIKQIWNTYWIENVNEFKNWEQKYKQMKQKSIQNISKQQKYNNISELYKINKNLQINENSFRIHKDLLSDKLRKYSNEFKSLLNIQNLNASLDLTKTLDCFKSQVSTLRSICLEIEEQEDLLINIPQIKIPQMNIKQKKQNQIVFNTVDLSKSKIYDEISTERTHISQQSTLRMSRKIQNKVNLNSKSIMTLTNINEINKIQTGIKQINAKNLQISNTDGKKIINQISKSFVKSLDLSNNKLTGLFLKDLNKTQIGKYLKTIKLQGNNIDIKDPAIGKKIQMLKKDGVIILL